MRLIVVQGFGRLLLLQRLSFLSHVFNFKINRPKISIGGVQNEKKKSKIPKVTKI